MKVPYTQKELEEFAAEGRTVVLQFRNAGVIRWSAGVSEYIITPLPRKVSGLPFTLRGRATACTPGEHQEMIRRND
ncbi:hypothetical protein UFOVP783_43 [uncultured Caudovirales phage]|uniref:Uncharacterized protein n=1 Tax=uncultured Caudovirales phage TaxID=2100421 RepID=A0A6J5NTZ5_9CAUD|nr:hypothetical protein UFOVP783_43 [uncultured Caudovirales phage]